MKLILFLFLLTSTVIAQQTINDLTAKKFQVVSTTTGSKPCPLMTETQRNAIGSPLNGQCIYNTTTSKLNVYNGTIWKAAGGGVDAWQTASVYAIGDLVIESNKIYQCSIAHTSGTFATDLAALKWTEISVGASDHNSLSGLQLSNTAVTYGHVDDQAQSIFGVKTFNSTISGSINGNASTVTTNANSIGDVTSIGNATTYNGIVPIAKGGTNLSAVGTETKTLKVVSGALAYAEEDRSNLLLNPNFEWSTLSDWTCTSGTCTSTNTSGEFSEGLRALKVSLTAQAMNVSQSIATTAGSLKQYVIGASYKVPSTLETFQICTLIAGVEKTCVPSSNLILNNEYQTIEIPEVITAGSTVGIKFKTSSDTGDAFFDKTYIKQGIGYQNLMLDNTFTAQGSITAVVSNLNKSGWVANGSIAGAFYTYPISGFTVAPNCWATFSTQGGGSPRILDIVSTSSTVAIEVTNIAGAATSTTMSFGCQKSGNDYLAASSSVYSQASGNYSRTAYTPTFTGFGIVTGIDCYHSRDGEFLDVDCKFTSGTPTAVEARISLPTNLTSSSLGVVRVVGKGNNTLSSTTRFSGITPLIEPSVTYFTLGSETSSTNGLTRNNGNSIINAGGSISFTARIPIAGWSNAAQIVGSFAGVPAVPGYQGLVDTFSVSYGATATTACTTGATCSYNDAIGSGVSVGFSSTGNYLLTFSKTYIKVKCSIFSHAPGVSNTINGGSVPACSNCSSKIFDTVGSVSGTAVNSYGTLICQGSY